MLRPFAIDKQRTCVDLSKISSKTFRKNKRCRNKTSNHHHPLNFTIFILFCGCFCGFFCFILTSMYLYIKSWYQTRNKHFEVFGVFMKLINIYKLKKFVFYNYISNYFFLFSFFVRYQRSNGSVSRLSVWLVEWWARVRSWIKIVQHWL